MPTPVADDLMMTVLADAQLAPSNCNTQPWSVHIVSGDKLSELSRTMITKSDAEEYTLDFSFDTNDFLGPYGERSRSQGKAYYDALGVSRADKEGRRRIAALNYSFFGAPHVALLFMPAIGDSVRVAADLGMYAQTFLLSLTARGLGGVPQTILGFFAEPIREVLGISGEMKMLFGISFGYPDEAAIANRLRMDRVSFQDSTTFHS